MPKNVHDDQEALPGIAAEPKREVIQAIEKLCLEKDRLCGSRTAINDDISGLDEKIQEELRDRKIRRYTFRDDRGVLQDVELVEKVRKKKSAANTKERVHKPNGKKSDEAAA